MWSRFSRACEPCSSAAAVGVCALVFTRSPKEIFTHLHHAAVVLQQGRRDRCNIRVRTCAKERADDAKAVPCCSLCPRPKPACKVSVIVVDVLLLRLHCVCCWGALKSHCVFLPAVRAAGQGDCAVASAGERGDVPHRGSWCVCVCVCVYF